MKRIVICSGKVNRNGYKVIAEGIRIDSYQKNPILLAGHNSVMLSIGRMNDLKLEEIDGRQALTGMPEFDMDDPFAVLVANKYEKGYMNSCSMGHSPYVTTDAVDYVEAGQIYETVLETELIEVSMTNIPGDRDAVVMQLSNDTSVPKLRKLNFNHKTKIMELGKLKKMLNLAPEADEVDITKAVETLQLSVKSAQAERVRALIELGVANGHVNDDNRATYEVLASSNYDHVEKLLKIKAVEAEADATLSASGGESVVGAIKAIAGKGHKPQETLSFDKLSRDNPAELLRIQREEPERYKQLAAEYVKGK